MHNLDDILDRIAEMNAGDLDRLQAAIDERRRHTNTSTVVERRDHLDGILQLEYRANPKTGKQRGPYWYFKHRKNGKQKTVYIGVTDDPVGRLGELS